MPLKPGKEHIKDNIKELIKSKSFQHRAKVAAKKEGVPYKKKLVQMAAAAAYDFARRNSNKTRKKGDKK